MIYPDKNSFAYSSGYFHHGQVDCSMMTNATKMVDKPIMEKKTYTKPEVLKMVAEIQAKTKWSRDRTISEAHLKGGKTKSIQRSKDWYRKDRDIQIDYLDTIAIAELHQKVFTNESIDDFQIARRQLNSALKFWFDGEDTLAVNTLALEAYKIMRPYKNITQERSTEGMIFSCIIKIQASGITLSEQESAFSLWFAIENPKSFKDDMRQSVPVYASHSPIPQTTAVQVASHPTGAHRWNLHPHTRRHARIVSHSASYPPRLPSVLPCETGLSVFALSTPAHQDPYCPINETPSKGVFRATC
jgi:hypothetical protein